MNYNEDYAYDEDSVLLERNMIEKESRRQTIQTLDDLKAILDEDDFSNWDINQYDSIEDAVEDLDDGFGLGEL